MQCTQSFSHHNNRFRIFKIHVEYVHIHAKLSNRGVVQFQYNSDELEMKVWKKQSISIKKKNSAYVRSDYIDLSLKLSSLIFFTFSVRPRLKTIIDLSSIFRINELLSLHFKFSDSIV